MALPACQLRSFVPRSFPAAILLSTLRALVPAAVVALAASGIALLIG